jgi:hypothetical protein
MRPETANDVGVHTGDDVKKFYANQPNWDGVAEILVAEVRARLLTTQLHACCSRCHG